MLTLHTAPPCRVRVVGNSGSGKTTFAIALASRVGVAIGRHPRDGRISASLRGD